MRKGITFFLLKSKTVLNKKLEFNSTVNNYLQVH